MKKGIICSIIMLLACGVVYAADYNFTPDPFDLEDLRHSYAYAWGIDWTLPAGEVIVGANLTIANINNWRYEPDNNWLYIHMADSAPAGGTPISANVLRWDDSSTTGDYWSGIGTHIATYTDNTHGPETLIYDLAALGLLDELTAYSSDGNFYIAFDPDCHYYNCGVSLTIETEPVPEPSSILALMVGGLPFAAGIRAAYKRRKS